VPKPLKKSPPAMKADIKLLMESIGRLYDANERWKDEVIGAQERWKDEIKRHFDLKVETIRHDLLGANKDRIENHEHRITRLERRTGAALA
jgi:hypothetical protein